MPLPPGTLVYVRNAPIPSSRGVVDPLGGDLGGSCERESVPGIPIGPLAHDHRSWSGERLQPGGHIDRLPGDQAFALPSVDRQRSLRRWVRDNVVIALSVAFGIGLLIGLFLQAP